MTSPDRATSEMAIRQLISDMETSLQSLQRGVNETQQLWHGKAADQFSTTFHDELTEAHALLVEMRAVVAAPPWGAAPQ